MMMMMMMIMMMMEGDNKRLNYNTHTAKQQIYFRESYMIGLILSF